MPHDLNALGAMIFAGGFTLGVREHFHVLGHVEGNTYGVKSAKRNMPHLPIWVGTDKWKPAVDHLSEYHNIDFMYANPPCAVWSVAGSVMTGGADAWRRDPRLQCWRDCFNLAMYARPKVYVCESVTRAFTAGREFMEELASQAKEQGYAVTHLTIDAQWHGLPQRRKRYFFVAHRVGLQFPQPNWAPPKTAAEALAEVDDPGPVSEIKDPLQRELLPKLEPGKPLRVIWEEVKRQREGPEENWERITAGVKGRPRMFLHRIHPDRPIGTITGDYFIHPHEDRFLGMKELRWLNGIPTDYWLEGDPKAHASLIARGVAPPVAEYVARAARNAIEVNAPQEPLVRHVDYMEPPQGLFAA